MNKVKNRTYRDKAYKKDNSYLAWLGIEYIGEQERLNNFPLDMFNDLETHSTFLRCPGETVLEARDRIRKGYGK